MRVAWIPVFRDLRFREAKISAAYSSREKAWTRPTEESVSEATEAV